MQDQANRLLDRMNTWLAQHAITLARIGVGIIFFWFGVLKFFPGLSPAEDFAGRTIELMTFGLLKPNISVPILAAWETLIGIGFLTGWLPRATVVIMLAQMVGTMSPLVLLPQETFTRFPYAPTLEGQYIIKNLALIGVAVIVWASKGRGKISPHDEA